MKKVKKSLLSIFAGVCAIVTIPFAQANNTDDLIEKVKQSIDQTYIQSESKGVLSLAENELVAETVYTKNGNRMKQETEFSLDFYAKTLPSELIEDWDFLTADFELNLEAVAKVFFDKSNQDIFYEIGDYEVRVNSGDRNAKHIIEGFFEITKIFTGETYYINLKKLADEFDSFAEEYEEIDGMNLMDFDGQDAALVLELFLVSGFFDVNLNGNVYTITLKDEVEKIDRQAMIDVINEMDFLTVYLKEEVVEELGNPIKESDYVELNEGLEKLKKYFDFEIKLTEKNNLITSFEFDADFKLEKLLAENGLDLEMEDLSFTQEAEIMYEKRSFSFPKEGSAEISFNKIMGMFLGFEQKVMEEWGDTEGDWNFEDTDNSWSEIEKLEVEETLEAIIAKFGAETWFVPYVQDLLERDVIDTFYSPARNVSQIEFRELLERALYFDEANYAIYEIPNEAWRELGNYENISKLTAVDYIVRSFFPEEANPTAFAREKGIVSKSFSVLRAKEQDLILAEFVKMLSVAIDILEQK